jgi:hypothetical protein
MSTCKALVNTAVLSLSGEYTPFPSLQYVHLGPFLKKVEEATGTMGECEFKVAQPFQTLKYLIKAGGAPMYHGLAGIHPEEKALIRLGFLTTDEHYLYVDADLLEVLEVLKAKEASEAASRLYSQSVNKLIDRMGNNDQ